MNAVPPAQHNREQLEVELLQRVRRAEEAYRATAAQHRNVMENYRAMLDHPDGAYALSRAAKAERAALKKYTAALNAFTELILHGRRPGGELKPV